MIARRIQIYGGDSATGKEIKERMWAHAANWPRIIDSERHGLEGGEKEEEAGDTVTRDGGETEKDREESS